MVWISGARHVEEWTRRLATGRWLSDGKLVLKAESGAQALAKLMAAEGYNRPGTRIGVAKLKGSRFDPEGLVPSIPCLPRKETTCVPGSSDSFNINSLCNHCSSRSN